MAMPTLGVTVTQHPSRFTLSRQTPLLPGRSSLFACSRSSPRHEPPRFLGRGRAVSAVSKGDMNAKEPVNAVGEDDKAAAASEDTAYKKREKESKEAGIDIDKIRPPQGGDPPPPGSWQWTLNWDPIVDGIIVGSCPRTPDDVNRLAKEAKIEAIVCLQSQICHEAMGIDWNPIEERARSLGILVTRVPVRDFDRLDQAAMVPEMAKMVGVCRALGLNTYIHCTAGMLPGINRASLSVVSYFTWICKMDKETALSIVRDQRPQANPYMGPWELARSRMLSGREQEVYIKTQDAGSSREDGGDWVWRDWKSAEEEVINEYMMRQVAATLSVVKNAAALPLKPKESAIEADMAKPIDTVDGAKAAVKE